ncbi:hypothetical protein ACFYKX_09170 [Cytobacillus sp. FJAT-54145]|uniref:Uncharacterized protein n=1 Tax=Cytobacillus spartinae TaxID=3299023 RepID=A0ABW6K997_9BACI
MISRRHILFNLTIIIIPWLSLLFLDKRNIKRYIPASVIIGIVEFVSHIYGHRNKWWKFYDKPKSFIRDELPFDIGPYVPLSIWILKASYGNFKKFVLLNATANALFTFVFMPFLKKIKIIRLNRLNYFQFFFYIHYKAYLLYGAQYLFEKVRPQRLGSRF